MKNKSKNKVFYTLKNQNDRDVQIDLNNYKVTCNVTGARKGFYHKYLAGLIKRDYANNIDTFRTMYVSREGRKVQNDQKKLDRVVGRIDLLLNQIDALKIERDRLRSVVEQTVS